jgi:hypothetical protein
MLKIKAKMRPLIIQWQNRAGRAPGSLVRAGNPAGRPKGYSLVDAVKAGEPPIDSKH